MASGVPPQRNQVRRPQTISKRRGVYRALTLARTRGRRQALHLRRVQRGDVPLSSPVLNLRIERRGCAQKVHRRSVTGHAAERHAARHIAGHQERALAVCARGGMTRVGTRSRFDTPARHVL